MIEADGVTIVSGSPERFLATDRGRLETRPIKGTRPPGPGGAEELAAAPKDAAEHLMIVDLERNDLGRIAETGSVTVDELEPARRGPYCGAFGYFAPQGCELAIAIRIGVVKGYELRVHVGGGIVADSDPAAELAETDVKAAAWIAALDHLRATRAARR